MNNEKSPAQAVTPRFRNINPRACFCCHEIKRSMFAKTVTISVWKATTFHLCFQCEKKGHWFTELFQ